MKSSNEELPHASLSISLEILPVPWVYNYMSNAFANLESTEHQSCSENVYKSQVLAG